MALDITGIIFARADHEEHRSHTPHLMPQERISSNGHHIQVVRISLVRSRRRLALCSSHCSGSIMHGSDGERVHSAHEMGHIGGIDLAEIPEIVLSAKLRSGCL